MPIHQPVYLKPLLNHLLSWLLRDWRAQPPTMTDGAAAYAEIIACFEEEMGHV